MFKCDFREEAKILEQQGNAKRLKTSQDQILGEDTYADSQAQALFNEPILSLVQKEALNAWDRIKNQEIELNHIPRLNRARENRLVSFYKD